MFFSKKSSVKSVFISPPILYTERLILRKIVLTDVEDMFCYSKDPETSKFLLWEPHPDISFTRNHISRLQKEYKKAEFFDFGIEYSSDHKFIGTVGFTSIDEKSNSAEVGYVLSPDYHRMGIAPEALKRLMQFGFDDLGFDRLFARFMEENIASRKVLEKCGFSEIGFQGEEIFKNGKYQKIIEYQITKTEYEKMR